MPELPEVHTTVTGLQKVLPGQKITGVWCGMWSTATLAKGTIKNRSYFPYFKKHSVGATIIAIHRRAKHILIELNNGYTIIIHMKMTGHLMYGKYKQTKTTWVPLEKDSPLNDPYNRHIRVVFTLSNGKHLAFCDSRKFGTIVVGKTDTVHTTYLSHLGPEPLDTHFTLADFKERLLLSPSRPIKTVLMDQHIIAGIGNIYSDEMLYRAHIRPTRTAQSLRSEEWKLLFTSMRHVLKKGINFGGDSTSDYRNIDGVRGAFHESHYVYRRTGEHCYTKGCKGSIVRNVIGGRSAHFCPICQY